MAIKHTFYRNLSIVLFCGLLFSSWLNIQQYEIIITLKTQLHKTIPAAVQSIKYSAQKAQESFEKVTVIYRDAEKKAVKDSIIEAKSNLKSPVVITTDTIGKYIAFLGVSNRERDFYRKSDSTTKVQLRIANHKTDSVIKGNQNLTIIVASLDGRLSELDSARAAKSINTVVGEQVKVKRSRFFFSKQDDYLKLRKLGDTASINGTNYILYPTENKYTNQLLLQARASFNYATDKFAFGPGLELKFGGKGLNVAYLGDPTAPGQYFKKAAIVFGLRLDVLHTTFRSRLINRFNQGDFGGYYGGNFDR